MKRFEILKKEILIGLLILIEFFMFIIQTSYFVNVKIVAPAIFIVSIIGIIFNIIKRKENKMFGRNIFCYCILLQYWLFLEIYAITTCRCGHHLINSLVINVFFLIECISYFFFIKKGRIAKILFMLLAIVIMIVVMIITRNDLNKIHAMQIYDDENQVQNLEIVNSNIELRGTPTNKRIVTK